MSQIKSVRNPVFKKKPFKWKGFDFIELAVKWKLKKLKDTEPEDIKKWLWENGVVSAYDKNNDKKQKSIAKDIRGYLKALIKSSKKLDYQWPLWEGLANVKHDETLIKFTIDLIDHMWT